MKWQWDLSSWPIHSLATLYTVYKSHTHFLRICPLTSQILRTFDRKVDFWAIFRWFSRFYSVVRKNFCGQVFYPPPCTQKVAAFYAFLYFCCTQVELVPVRNESDSVVLFLCTYRDITAFKVQNHTKPIQSKHNQTEPNQTKPNQTIPNETKRITKPIYTNQIISKLNNKNLTKLY